MSPREVLIMARALIAKPEHWTKRSYARGLSGESVDAGSRNAVCWCSVGAIDRISLVDGGRALDALSTAMGGGGITSFNDSSDHATVLAAFDRAIESAS